MSVYSACDEFRETVIRRIEQKMSLRYQDIDDPFWTSSSLSASYNAAKWSVKGCSEAIDLIDRTPPLPNQSVEQYARMLEDSLRDLKKKINDDYDDVDGFAAGAIVDIINMVKELSQ